MAIGDIQIYSEGAFGYPGDDVYACAANTTVINAGEPVAIALGNSTGNVVTAAATNTPVVATDFYVGIAATTSTQTASAAGTVRVMKFASNNSFLIKPTVAATWDTQTEYDALVSARVLIDLTTGSYTLLASDGSTHGCVVMPLDVMKFPGKVCFNFRNAVNYLS